MSIRSTTALLFLTLGLIASAQDSTIVYPTTAAASATILPSASGYTYAGCYNETVNYPGSSGARALQDGGKSGSANNTMTPLACIEYCASGPGSNGTSPLQYAGLEYGRECWCGTYLSALSEQLNETARCDLACNGNSSEICGGSLALTLYNLTDRSQLGAAASALGSNGAGFWATAAAITLLFAALM
ncbi:hypothetical protein K431DRAFT_245310 [Polychaeton citri CBS 116435]|uniref:WSC domain-containing protein n=1 Tax=Polychaeton citri CBS 116435 TaxID=1314669 RepID=A0A9P4Q865_9PEZI|nr:hypothetical protein K431DRAFT_245310 [Polychaeton citri CBS 116435]